MNCRVQIGFFQFEEDPSAKNAQTKSKKFHELTLLMNFSHTNPQVKTKKTMYYNLLCAVIEKLTEVEKNEFSDNSIRAFCLILTKTQNEIINSDVTVVKSIFIERHLQSIYEIYRKMT